MYLLLGKIVAVKQPFQLKNKTSVFSKKITNICSNDPQIIYISVRLFTPFEKFEKSSSAGLPANYTTENCFLLQVAGNRLTVTKRRLRRQSSND